MGMPVARGLFHRAAVQSGSLLQAALPAQTSELAAAVLAELGLDASSLDQLHALPVERLVAAGQAAVRRGAPPSGDGIDFTKLARQLGWAPTVDGTVLPRHPFDPDASTLSADVPMLIGSVLNEFVSGVDNPDAYDLTLDVLRQQVRARYGERGDAILAAYHASRPDAAPFDLLSEIVTSSIRQTAVLQAERKAALGAAPTYMYWFTWRTPALGSRPGAFHSCEILFVFDNIEHHEQYTGGAPAAYDLAAHMSQAWISFARHGDPNHAGLPHWPAYAADSGATMIFDSVCAVLDDPDGRARHLVHQS